MSLKAGLFLEKKKVLFDFEHEEIQWEFRYNETKHTQTLSLSLLLHLHSEWSDLFYEILHVKSKHTHTRSLKTILDGTGLYLSAGGELGDGILALQQRACRFIPTTKAPVWTEIRG